MSRFTILISFAFAITLFASAKCKAENDEPVILDSVVLRPMYSAEVPAEQTGLLRQVSVREGDVVKRDQILATLDPLAAHLAMKQAVAERDQAKAKAENRINIQYTTKAIEVAEAELRRSQESNEKFPKSISQSQLDVERLTVEKLQLEKQQAEHDLLLDEFTLQLKENALEAAKLTLERHRLRAPFAGTIALVRGRVGEWVETGQPVLRLVAVDRLRAEGFLSAHLASSELVGKSVTFTSSVGEKKVSASGTLRFISPEMDPVTRQVRVWAELDNSGASLRPGEQGKLSIE